MYIYQIGVGEALKIFTPGNNDFAQIKKKVIQQPGLILMQLDYPNGLHLEIEEHPDRIIFYSNMELVRNEDGNFTAPSR